MASFIPWRPKVVTPQTNLHFLVILTTFNASNFCGEEGCFIDNNLVCAPNQQAKVSMAQSLADSSLYHRFLTRGPRGRSKGSMKVTKVKYQVI